MWPVLAGHVRLFLTTCAASRVRMGGLAWCMVPFLRRCESDVLGCADDDDLFAPADILLRLWSRPKRYRPLPIRALPNGREGHVLRNECDIKGPLQSADDPPLMWSTPGRGWV